MKKHYLDQTGVNNWLSWLYQEPVEQQMREQELIELSLLSWLSLRFELNPSQIAYVSTLPNSFRSNLGQEIIFAINNKLPITLLRETITEKSATILGSRDSVKVTEFRSQRSQQTAQSVSLDDDTSWTPVPELENLNASLTIQIYHLEDQ